jgi:superfamily II DNA/RNA helicase
MSHHIDPLSSLGVEWKARRFCHQIQNNNSQRCLTEEQRMSIMESVQTSHQQVLRPFQLEGVCAQFEGRDLLIQAPTGSGKTHAAGVPHWILQDSRVNPDQIRQVTIMVCPLISLAENMVRVLSHILKSKFIEMTAGFLSREI